MTTVPGRAAAPPAPPPTYGRQTWVSMYALLSISGFLLALALVVLLALSGTNLSGSVLAASAVVALVGAFGSIYAARNIAKQELTYGYIARFNGPELLSAWARLNRYWSLKRPPIFLDELAWAQLSETERSRIDREWKDTPETDRQEEKW